MIELGDHTLIIGERINPTGRPALAAELKTKGVDMVIADAQAQARAGAEIIDVNVGAAGVDEIEMLPRAALAVRQATGLPISLDSSDAAALRAALKQLPGEDTLVNSVTADEDMMDQLLPDVAESGAFIIGITKDREGIPTSVEKRLELAHRIVQRAAEFGIAAERILIDFLTIPVATDSQSANVTLACIERSRPELGVGTVLGASNISFGMPTRNVINASFLSMAIKAGLSAAIVNPLEEGVVQAILAADMLMGHDAMGRRFLQDYRQRRKL